MEDLDRIIRFIRENLLLVVLLCIFIGAIAGLFLLVGKAYNMGAIAEAAGYYRTAAPSPAYPPSEKGYVGEAEYTPRLYEKHASVSIEVKHGEATKVRDEIRSLVESYGGYVKEEYSTKNEYGRLTISLTVKVPQNKLQCFLNELKSRYNVVSMRYSEEEVSEALASLEAKIKTLEEEEKWLENLLNTTEDYRVALEIFRELKNVREQLLYTKNLLESRKGAVAYSTVDISIKEKPSISERLGIKEFIDGVIEFVTSLVRGIAAVFGACLKAIVYLLIVFVIGYSALRIALKLKVKIEKLIG